MATKLYLHAATSLQSGTLPTTKQTSQTIATTIDAYTAKRTMDTNIGTSQADIITNQSNSGTYWVTRFISPPLNQTSIAANTWTYGFACWCDSTTPLFPGDSNNSYKIRSALYVWRPSTGAKIATIFDGLSASSITNHFAITSEKTAYVTIAGAAAGSIAIDDVLIFEAMYNVFGGGHNFHWNYDGTTDITADNASISSAASFISTPENLAFDTGSVGPPIDCTSTAKVVTNKFIVKG